MQREEKYTNNLTYEQKLGRFLKNKDVTATFRIKQKDDERYFYKKKRF